MDIVVDRFQSGVRYRARGTVCPSSPPPHGPIAHRSPPADVSFRLKPQNVWSKQKGLSRRRKCYRLNGTQRWTLERSGRVMPIDCPVEVLATATC